MVKVSVYNTGDQVQVPGSRRSLEKRMAAPAVCLGESRSQRSLVSYSSWSQRVSTTERLTLSFSIHVDIGKKELNTVSMV